MDFYLGSFLQFSLSFLGCYVLSNKQRLMINTESNDCTVCSYFQLQWVLCRETVTRDINTMLESKRRCGARKTKSYCPFFSRLHWVVCPPERCFCAECDCFSAKSPFFFISLQRQGNIKTWLLLGTRMTKRAAPAWVSTRTTLKKDKYELVSPKVHEHLWRLAHAPQPWANSGARILLEKPALQTKPLPFMVIVVSSNTAASYWP